MQDDGRGGSAQKPAGILVLNILLTGSDGFTGRHFAKLAASKGHTIFPLKADLGDVVALDREVLEIAPEAVVHLAAISFVGHPDSTAFYAVPHWNAQTQG